jgi:hypothetical protein
MAVGDFAPVLKPKPCILSFGTTWRRAVRLTLRLLSSGQRATGSHWLLVGVDAVTKIEVIVPAENRNPFIQLLDRNFAGNNVFEVI